MTKQCMGCGADISTDDWYAFIRLKYCKRCAAAVHRMQKAAYARELRRTQREINNTTRELCQTQQEQLAKLRELLAIQREENRRLSAEIEEAKSG